jgi:leader peptidase (prepilin peptidase)/N-methyltransferase
MSDQLAAALTCLLIGVVGGLFVPTLISRIPEPEPEPDGAPAPNPAPKKALPPKELYADIARLPRLALWAALLSGTAGFVVGWQLEWSWALAYLLPLCSIGTALGIIDARTHLLPTKVIAPTYLLVVVLLVVAAVASGDLQAIARGAVGWAVYGLFFFVLWFFSRGALGYGDVRLSGVLGIVLGSLGFETFFMGMLGGALLGGLAGLVTMAVKGRRQDFAYGPYMLLGVLVGLLLGPTYASYLAGG